MHVHRRSRPTTLLAAVLLGAAALLGATSLATAAAARHHASFRALRWRVWVADSTGYATPHPAKLGSTYTLCNMDRLNELEIDYATKYALVAHLPYTLTLGSPSGSQKVRFAPRYRTGSQVEGWSANALSPTAVYPAAPGVYTVTIRAGAKTLMHAKIKLVSTNSCT